MTGSTPKERENACFLCASSQQFPSETFSPDNLVIHQGNHTFAILNKFPYSSGHILVSPKRHVGQLEDLTPEESLETMSLLQMATRALKTALKPDGFNVGINLGHIAGAGVPGHLHVHVVPRWSGDHNFMPVTGDTRVMPMLMDDIWNRIRSAWTSL